MALCYGTFAVISLLPFRLPFWSGSATEGLLATVCTEAIIVLLVAPFLYLRGWRWGDVAWGVSLKGSLLGIGVLVAYYAVAIATVVVLNDLRMPVSRPAPMATWAILLASTVNPLYEEWFGLGYIFRVFERHGPVSLILYGSALRLAVHLSYGLAAIAVAVPCGVVFGLIYWRYRTLWPFVLAHGLADLIGLMRHQA